MGCSNTTPKVTSFGVPVVVVRQERVTLTTRNSDLTTFRRSRGGTSRIDTAIYKRDRVSQEPRKDSQCGSPTSPFYLRPSRG